MSQEEKNRLFGSTKDCSSLKNELKGWDVSNVPELPE